MNELNKRSAGRFFPADWITVSSITILVYLIVRTFIGVFDEANVRNFVFAFSAGYSLILVAAFFYVKKDRKLNVASVVTAVSCAVLGLSVSLYGDILFSFFTVLLLFVLTASLCLSLSGSHVFPVSSTYYVLDVLYAMVVSPLLNFVPMTKAAFSGRKKSKGLSGAVLGAVLSVPVLAVVIVLLTNGDAAFENLTSKAFDTLFSGYAFISVLVTLVLSGYIFSVMYATRTCFAVSDYEKSRKAVAGFHCMSVSIINGFTGAVSAVYVVYLLSQLTYFFGAFGGSIPESVRMTVAEYSRRGFFEMSVVAAINLLLIFVAVLLAKRTDGKIAKSVKGISLFLCVFTEILIITAMSKMALYISRYGLTRKRVFVTAAILVLFVTFICVMIRHLKRNFPYMKIVFSVFLVTYMLLSVVNVNAVIANYNVNAYLSGRLETVDTEMLSSFGSAGVEPLMKLVKNPDSLVAADAKNELGNLFGYDDFCLFRIDADSGEITLGEDACGLYDSIVLMRMKKDSAAYMAIVNEVNPRPLDCYVFVSAARKITGIGNGFYSAENGEEVFEPYRLYRMPVSSQCQSISLFVTYEYKNETDDGDEYNDIGIEQKDCKLGGVIEIGEDKDENIVCQSYGEPGISLEEAEEILAKIKAQNRKNSL